MRVGLDVGTVMSPVTAKLSPRELGYIRPPAERANQITHAIGVVIGLVGAFHVISRLGPAPVDHWQSVACWLYSFSLVALFTASTLSHSFTKPYWRIGFRAADQVCIFLLIGGTYTPFALAHFRSGWSLLVPVGIWCGMAVAIAYKLIVRPNDNVPIRAYLVAAWVPGVVTVPVSPEIRTWILAGAACYTLGTLFLAFDHRARYFHAMWHLFVVAGSWFHIHAVAECIETWPR